MNVRHMIAPALFVAAALIATPAMAGKGGITPTCAYITGELHGEVYAAAATVIAVPDSGFEADPFVLNIDEEEHTILGMTFTTPGFYRELGGDVFIPGFELSRLWAVQAAYDLATQHSVCVAAGVVTPSVPVYVPASELNVPGTGIEIPDMTLNLAGRELSVPGRAFVQDGYTLVIPEIDDEIPSFTGSTPDWTLTLDYGADVTTMVILEPVIINLGKKLFGF